MTQLDLYLLVVCLGLLGAFMFCYKKWQQQKQATSESVTQNSQLTTELNRLTETYAPIIDVEKAISDRLAEADKNVDARQLLIKALERDIESLEKEKTGLKNEYKIKHGILQSLLAEIALYEPKLEDISFGLYKPVYNFQTSEAYKKKLEAIRQQEKSLITLDDAVVCPINWTVNGSTVEGKRMMKQYSKLLLRAFNGECDALIAKVSWNNIGRMQERLQKAFEAINKLGETNQIFIAAKYRNLKLEELKLEFELQEKIQLEKEEQRLIREQMREEEKALKEIEQAQRKAQEEESRYEKALAKAREEAQKATGEQLGKLDAKILQLEEALAQAQLQKERATSMAQLTKSGHVYVISNIGSFGENVYKIGMTRRLEPMDRVRELGDASVPFSFDVHALVYCDNAPELEYKLHRKFLDRRLNLVNNRREFFHVDIDEIEAAVREFGLDLTLTKLAEAKEYRESQSIRSTKSQVAIEPLSAVSDAFPASI